MNDQFDDSLKNHIRLVFEKFEDPTADEGWLLLREKFPEKGKKRPVVWLWWSSAAAILLLALGIGIWVNQKTEADKTITSIKPKKIIDTTQGNIVALQQPIPDRTYVTSDNYLTQAPSANKKPAIENIKSIISNNNVAVNQPNITNQPTVIIDLNKVDNTQSVATQVAVINNTSTNTIASQSIDNPTPVIKQPIVQKTEKPLLYADNSLKENKPNETQKPNDKPVKFGVYAATYFNYAEGSNNQLNMGVGFTSDIRITKNLKLYTGMAVAQNSLSYNNQAPTPAIQDKAFAYALGASNTTALGYASTSPTVKNYNAVLVGLDVPINLKYEFNPQKSRSYFSVGLSSGTFINQSYTYKYAIQSFSSFGTQQESAQQTSKNNFGDFYFARTLNISFGLGYPLGKKNHLVIEPFLKYPLAGLGSQQIHFGSSGINLKFDFQSTKK
jgi:hypothetical protein